jgi:hypothetical protein
MTQQRRTLSNKIRKQKKSEYLAKKRNTGHTNSTYSPSESRIRDLVNSYIQNPTAGSLQALDKSLPATTEVMKGSEETPLLFLSAEEEPMAVKFLEILPDHAVSDSKLLTLCLNIFVKLSAISYSLSAENSYYGRIPSSWCLLMVQNSKLISLLMKSARNYDSCLVILGNLVGDPSSQVCPALRQLGLVPTILSCIQQPVAVWVLTNAIRNDTNALASVYCSEELLSASLLETLLKSPQVATQAAWMTASLTGREEAVVRYLVSHPSFCPTLVALLGQLSSNDQLVPLLQALGYIASYEANVAPLLNLPSLIPTISQLLQTNTDKDVTVHVVWLMGCLLVDARIENHPSTVIAAPNLVPTLFQRLNLQQHSHLSLDERRDIAHALRNALALPPACDSDPYLPIVPAYLPDHQIMRPSLNSLIGMLSSSNADAMIAAVYVLDLLLRQDESLRVHMEEENITSALEHVCESSVEEAADVAADLLDDFFYADEDDNDEMFMPPTNNAPLPFGFPDPTAGGGGGGMGRGRGRGAVIPSWMSKP